MIRINNYTRTVSDVLVFFFFSAYEKCLDMSLQYIWVSQWWFQMSQLYLSNPELNIFISTDGFLWRDKKLCLWWHCHEQMEFQMKDIATLFYSIADYVCVYILCTVNGSQIHCICGMFIELSKVPTKVLLLNTKHLSSDMKLKIEWY